MSNACRYKFKDDHIFRLTDDTGMFQHCKYGIPDPTKGYTTDDNARALIMAVMLYEKYKKKKYLNLMYRYTSFVLNSLNAEGKFKNFMGYNREFLEEEGSQDCFGRCLWALGYTLASRSVPINIKGACRYILNKSISNVSKLTYPKAKAYAIIGLGYIDTDLSKEYIRKLADSLVKGYEEHKEENWNWFEDFMSYGNAVLPWSLLVAYRLLKQNKLLEVCIESMEFLKSVTFRKGYFKPIGCKGWFKKDGAPAEFDEQPLEACETLLACIEAYKVTGDREYLKAAEKCFDWFNGLNSKGLSLVDPDTGGCYDGITEDGVNFNQGAESIISYVISYLAIENYIKQGKEGGG